MKQTKMVLQKLILRPSTEWTSEPDMRQSWRAFLHWPQICPKPRMNAEATRAIEGIPVPNQHFKHETVPFAPSSFLLLVVVPGATGSVLAPSSDALCS